MPIHPWRESELTLTTEHDYSNPYTDVEVWADFTHDSGLTLRRPAFWDGARASPRIPDEGGGPRVYICCDDLEI